MTAAASFPPHFPAHPRIVILGSLPGAASLAARQYYAHPRNQFWRLLGAVLGEELARLPYAERLHTVAAHGIGLWDVVQKASRKGSLDGAIRDAVPNDLALLAAHDASLKAIAFNGAKAHSIGRNRLAGVQACILRLPSSSPAHAAMPFEAKRDAWLQLRAFL